MKGVPAMIAAASEGGELYLVNAHIAEYVQAGRNGHAPTRPRKLLLHRKEIGRIAGAIQREGMTVVPDRECLRRCCLYTGPLTYWQVRSRSLRYLFPVN